MPKTCFESVCVAVGLAKSPMVCTIFALKKHRSIAQLWMSYWKGCAKTCTSTCVDSLRRMRACCTNIGECARCALKSCFLFNHLNNECARNHGVLTTAFEHKKVSQTPFFEKKFSLELFQARTTHTTLTKRVETDE